MTESKERIDQAFMAVVGRQADEFVKWSVESDVDAPRFPLLDGLKGTELYKNRKICADYYDEQMIILGSPRKAYR